MVRRSPRGENTSLGAVNRLPQQETGETCGLDVPRSWSQPEPVLSEPEPVLSEPEPVTVTVVGPSILVNRGKPHVL